MVSAMAALGLTLGAMAQGAFNLDDTPIAPGLAVNSPGNYYNGTFGMEVWELNGTIIPAGINLSGAPGSGVLGYNTMVVAGFVKEITYADQAAVGGVFVLGEADMWNVSPPGATVVVALAAWNSGDPSWSAMLANANQATRAGVVAFDQPTAVYPAPGSPILYPNLAMSQDLVISAIPEPPGPALAGLGVALLLLFHSRRCRGPGTRSRQE
jgi:hypothetical protein